MFLFILLWSKLCPGVTSKGGGMSEGRGRGDGLLSLSFSWRLSSSHFPIAPAPHASFLPCGSHWPVFACSTGSNRQEDAGLIVLSALEGLEGQAGVKGGFQGTWVGQIYCLQ